MESVLNPELSCRADAESGGLFGTIHPVFYDPRYLVGILQNGKWIGLKQMNIAKLSTARGASVCLTLSFCKSSVTSAYIFIKIFFRFFDVLINVCTFDSTCGVIWATFCSLSISAYGAGSRSGWKTWVHNSPLSMTSSSDSLSLSCSTSAVQPTRYTFSSGSKTYGHVSSGSNGSPASRSTETVLLLNVTWGSATKITLF